MRNGFLLIFFLITIKESSAQKYNEHSYSLSNKRYKQAFIFLGGGTFFVLVGRAIIEKKYDPTEPDKDNIGYAIASIGGLSILTSVVFFIDARMQKDKRLNLKFKEQSLPVLRSNAFLIRQIPSVTITISI